MLRHIVSQISYIYTEGIPTSYSWTFMTVFIYQSQVISSSQLYSLNIHLMNSRWVQSTTDKVNICMILFYYLLILLAFESSFFFMIHKREFLFRCNLLLFLLSFNCSMGSQEQITNAVTILSGIILNVFLEWILIYWKNLSLIHSACDVHNGKGKKMKQPVSCEMFYFFKIYIQILTEIICKEAQ